MFDLARIGNREVPKTTEQQQTGSILNIGELRTQIRQVIKGGLSPQQQQIAPVHGTIVPFSQRQTNQKVHSEADRVTRYITMPDGTQVEQVSENVRWYREE